MTCRCGHDFLWYAVTAALGVQTVPLHPLHATYNAPFKTVPLHPFHATSNAPFLRIAAPFHGLPRLPTPAHARSTLFPPSVDLPVLAVGVSAAAASVPRCCLRAYRDRTEYRHHLRECD